MRIGIIGSMQFAEEMLKTKKELEKLGHKPFLTSLIDPFVGKTAEEKEAIKLEQKSTKNPIKEFWNKMKDGDAVLCLNYEKNGIENYIGGNTFLELGFAHVLSQKIFLLNPIPEINLIKTEIAEMQPTIINGDLSKIG